MVCLTIKRIAAVTAVFISVFSCGGTEVVYRWSFDRKFAKPYWLPYFPEGKENKIFTTAKVADGAVFPGKSLTGKPAYIAAKLPRRLGDGTSAVVIRFSPDNHITKPMALFTYAEQGWGQGHFGLYLTADSRLRIYFYLPKEKPAIKYNTFSSRLELRPGGQYTLQVSLDKGNLLAYLNGKQILERKDAPSFASFRFPVGKYFPVVTFGCTNERNRPEQQFQGSITSVEYCNSIPEIPESSGSSNSLNCRNIREIPVIDGRLDELFYASLNWTSPFLVFGKENKEINGIWESADAKFVKNAAKATLFTDGKYLYTAFKAFFPADTPPDNSDAVEFFLRPEGKTTWQIITDIRGRSQFYSYSSETAGNAHWIKHGIKTAAKVHKDHYAVEMAIPLSAFGCKKIPAAGSAWRGNFARVGKSCGGLSSWAPVGNKFFTPAVFGYFLYGSEKDYFKAELKKISAEFAALPDVAQKAAEMQKDAEKVSRMNFEQITRQLDHLKRFAIKKFNAGKSMLIWQHDPWSDFGPDLRIPVTEEIKELELAVPRGARAITSFIMSNLTDRHGMFTLKYGGDSRLIHRIRFREGGFIESGKRVFPDVMFDLPLGEVVRLAPESSNLIWLDINTTGMKPGIYKGYVSVIPAYSGFKRRVIKLSLRVSKVDLADVSIPVWTYPLRNPQHIGLLKDYGFNTTSLQAKQAGPDPVNGQYDFSSIDQEIEAFLKNGIPLKEIRLKVYVDVLNTKIKLPNGKIVGFLEPEWKKEYGKRLLLFRDYIRKKYNMGYDSFLFSTIDEPNGDPDKPGTHAWYAFRGAEFIKSVDPKFRIFCNPWRIGDGTDSRYIAVYDVLAPCLPRLMPQKAAVKLYEKSRAQVWSYTVQDKSGSPLVYRRMSWFHMHHGFRGTPTFYDLFDFAGDQFYSHDSRPNNSKITTDYGVVYRNSLWWTHRYHHPERVKFNFSRRLEAWYLGIIDFKVSEYCRNRIAELKKQGVDTLAFEKEFDRLAARGASLDGDMDKASAELLKLAEKLLDVNKE